MDAQKRKRTRQETRSALFNWGMVILLVAGVFNHFGKRHAAQQAAEPDLVSASGISSLATKAKGALPSMEQLNLARKKILPDLTETILTTQDIDTGTGAVAQCGQQVSVSFESFDEADTPLPDKAEKAEPRRYAIGNGEAMPALEQGVLGMKQGGTRLIFSPPQMAYGAPNFAAKGMPSDLPVRLKLHLLDVSPELPAPEATSFRFIDRKRGAGLSVQCGQPVKLNITVWDIEGKKRFSTIGEKPAPIILTPGHGSQFIGLEQAVVGIKPGGERTIIVPPAYQKILKKGKETLDITFPKDQTVLVDIESIR